MRIKVKGKTKICQLLKLMIQNLNILFLHPIILILKSYCNVINIIIDSYKKMKINLIRISLNILFYFTLYIIYFIHIIKNIL